MSFFSKHKSSKAPQPTAASPMTMAQFLAKAKALPEFGPILQRFGTRRSELMLQALYDRNLRMKGPDGVWKNGGADYDRVAVGNTLLKIRSADMPTFDTFLKEQLRQDELKTQGRVTYLDDLKAKAINGELRAKLDRETEPEGNYHTQRAPSQPAPGAPAIPAQPAHLDEQLKALKWIAGNADSNAKNVYYQVISTHARGGRFPITGMEVLNAIWRKLVTGAPHYRAVNIMQPTKYPSSLAGDHIVRSCIADFNARTAPTAGSDAWYDWALYFFAVIMTSQAFTDGNKRVARTAYGLILLNGGVDFKAPNSRYGAELGDM